MDIRQAIENYTPFNEQEAADKTLILAFLAANPDAFYRSNRIAHMTASAWVVNPARDKVLMVYHKIYDSWSWTGGRCCPTKSSRSNPSPWTGMRRTGPMCRATCISMSAISWRPTIWTPSQSARRRTAVCAGLPWTTR